MTSLIFLSGPMGSGKSSVAPRVAERLSIPCFDLDARIAEQEHASVADLFRKHGEPGFRAIERRALQELVANMREGVIALGGGAVLDRESRHLMLRKGILITLRAGVDELLRRVRGTGDRPLLAVADAQTTLAQILAERASVYAECHAELSTEGRALDDVASDIIEVAREAPVVVPLGDRTYRVEIGAGVRERVGSRARACAPSGDVSLVVTDENVQRHWLADVRSALQSERFKAITVALEPGEKHKTITSIERIWDAALDGGIDRRGVLVALGGGVVGDLTGFGASTVLRGMSFGQVPTTLLAMVDSSVGGKTGIDRRQGKNLIGTFQQPRFVLCDVDTLRTLPDAERRSGLAEVLKSAWLAGEDAVQSLERDASALVSGDQDATVRAIRMAVGLKSAIVTADEHESGERMLLNLGHTIGHAIEAAGGYHDLRHGEAVALGMIAAFRVARGIGEDVTGHAERLERLIGTLGLPSDLDAYLSADALQFVSSDKKRRGQNVTFVVPAAPGATRLTTLPIADLPKLLA